jgi:hypothetical protein
MIFNTYFKHYGTTHVLVLQVIIRENNECKSFTLFGLCVCVCVGGGGWSTSVTYPRSTKPYIRPCVPTTRISQPDYIYCTFPLHFCIQSSLYVSLLSTSIPSHTNTHLPRFTFLLFVYALEHNLSWKRRTQLLFARPLTHWQTHLYFHLLVWMSPVPNSQHSYLKKKSICLW